MSIRYDELVNSGITSRDIIDSRTEWTLQLTTVVSDRDDEEVHDDRMPRETPRKTPRVAEPKCMTVDLGYHSGRLSCPIWSFQPSATMAYKSKYAAYCYSSMIIMLCLPNLQGLGLVDLSPSRVRTRYMVRLHIISCNGVPKLEQPTLVRRIRCGKTSFLVSCSYQTTPIELA